VDIVVLRATAFADARHHASNIERKTMAAKREVIKYNGYEISKQTLIVAGTPTERFTPYRPDKGGPLKQQPTLEDAQRAVDEEISRRR